MRVTMKVLEDMIEEINRSANLPTAYTKDEDGKFKSNPGSLILDAAYGNYGVNQIVSYCGAVNNLSGFMSARELYQFLTGVGFGTRVADEAERCKEQADVAEENDARRRAAQKEAIENVNNVG